MSYPEIKLCIGGVWKTSTKRTPIINPSSGESAGELPHATTADLDAALDAAVAAEKTWSRTAPAERETIMLRAAAILKDRTEDIARAVVTDQGKTLFEARVEVSTAHDRIMWDAAEGRRLYGRIVPSRPGLRQMVTRHPFGVVAAFTPWNYPLASPTRKVAGALAAGCTIILKGAEETPSGAMALVQAFVDAGVPAGAVNLVFGTPSEISEHLIPKPDVRLVTFTGSVPVGKHLGALAGKHMKPAILELGGNSPVIVCEDASADHVAQASAIAKARNSGQVCVSPTRFFVHEAVYDPFVRAFGARASDIRVGPGDDPDSIMGPLANARRLEAIESYVADAISRGARVVTGGKRLDRPGNYYPLTVLADVAPDARAMTEEPFGPLALVTPYRDLDDAIARANNVDFALSAYAFTDSARNAAKLADDLECGALAINHFVSTVPEAPFGGTKDSGYGREGGTEGLEGYTYTKTVSHLT
ncbi:NAD-dependent succinate-semialdehyde dehydrogenase [Terricaulis silvestris]|uniref:Alpha-ketoglutaric semialdehyde dehydrogenase n=1 Tax=Terricaulis silvestris TaxID=2686094 RepID=A0A6I6MLU3_9CAUL|nr:NAD-dependent succinate-semialdehyde dehydrogenase [Terricaulis silvestris]QGZ93687.1 Alpha-ketoglutaric semialdehyde dehydrogenase [Terricaulis silvestris]